MRLKCNLRLPAALLALEMVMRHNSLTQVTCDVETVSKHQLQTRFPALTATHAAVRTLCHNGKCDETQKPNVVKEPQTPVYSRTVIQKKKTKKQNTGSTGKQTVAVRDICSFFLNLPSS